MKLLPTTKPLDHQYTAVAFAVKHKYIINADEMGLGKTLSSIATACQYDSGEATDKIIVVTPAFLKDNWLSEFLKFCTPMPITVINKERDIFEAQFSKIVIVNYERLNLITGIFSQATIVIADEAHYLKNIEAKRTFIFHELVKTYKPEMLLLLTGTPIKNRVPDFHSLLKLMSYCPSNSNGKKITDLYPTPLKFSKRFCNEEIVQFKQYSPTYKRKITIRKSVFKGLNNKDELKLYFRDKFIRRLTDEVITLPEMKSRVVHVHYKSKDTKLSQMFEDFKIGSEPTGVLASLKSKSALAKASFTAEYARNLNDETGEPIVIFSDHVDAVKLIAEKLKVPFITGEVDSNKRFKLVQRFDKGDFDYLVCTLGAGSTGLNMTRANQMVINDLSYDPSTNAQAKKRIHRMGQERDCMLTFIAGSVIDEKIYRNLEEKEKDIKELY